MINASEQVRAWKLSGIWYIAPAGVRWIKEGYGVTLGDRVRLGDRVSLGNGVSLGDGVMLGDGVRLGDNTKHLLNLGYADGYYKNACLKDNVVYIGAGCRYFTLQEAIEHWSNHNQDREETLCLLESIKALANKRGYDYE
jgi:NDP-sugar pyrophosphorylase family protein